MTSTIADYERRFIATEEKEPVQVLTQSGINPSYKYDCCSISPSIWHVFVYAFGICVGEGFAPTKKQARHVGSLAALRTIRRHMRGHGRPCSDLSGAPVYDILHQSDHSYATLAIGAPFCDSIPEEPDLNILKHISGVADQGPAVKSPPPGFVSQPPPTRNRPADTGEFDAFLSRALSTSLDKMSTLLQFCEAKFEPTGAAHSISWRCMFLDKSDRILGEAVAASKKTAKRIAGEGVIANLTAPRPGSDPFPSWSPPRAKEADMPALRAPIGRVDYGGGGSSLWGGPDSRPWGPIAPPQPPPLSKPESVTDNASSLASIFAKMDLDRSQDHEVRKEGVSWFDGEGGGLAFNLGKEELPLEEPRAPRSPPGEQQPPSVLSALRPMDFEAETEIKRMPLQETSLRMNQETLDFDFDTGRIPSVGRSDRSDRGSHSETFPVQALNQALLAPSFTFHCIAIPPLPLWQCKVHVLGTLAGESYAGNKKEARKLAALAAVRTLQRFLLEKGFRFAKLDLNAVQSIMPLLRGDGSGKRVHTVLACGHPFGDAPIEPSEEMLRGLSSSASVPAPGIPGGIIGEGRSFFSAPSQAQGGYDRPEGRYDRPEGGYDRPEGGYEYFSRFR